VRLFCTCTPRDNLLLFLAESGTASIDLSKARKLEGVALLSRTLTAQWVLTALRTITTNHRNLRQVSVRAPCLSCRPDRADPVNVDDAIGKIGSRQWSEFDHLLAQLWKSLSIRPEVLYYTHPDGTGCRCVNSLLPCATRRGIVDLSRGDMW